MKTPVQQFTVGDRVSWPDKLVGKGVDARVTLGTGTVVNATLVGVRHPGYIYEVRGDSGQIRNLPTGLLTKVV